MSEKIRMGMVGGGPGAFIGAVHRIALRMDDHFDLVAGAFSSDAEKSAETGRELGLDPTRAYASWQAMADGESALPEDQRIQAVSIVTPNHVHHGPAVEFLNRGFHVICDKPLTISGELAHDLVKTVDQSGRIFALTHNYTGYPMIREARELVQSGALGKVLKVYAEYLQGWLVDPIEQDGQKQADWRVDPARSGPGGSLGDIGTHAFNLLEHVTGQQMTRMFARRCSMVNQREVDDDAMMLFELDGGATGSLVCSQVCAGRENGLRLRVYGSNGGIEWDQEHPNDLRVIWKDKPTEIRRPGNGYTGESSQSLTRVPPGHPEGYLEGFANIYSAFARAIRGENDLPDAYPTVVDGLRGVRFIEIAIASSAANEWLEFTA
jgi:predicted dehydrogenase